MALAQHFAGYIKIKKKHFLQVYVGECFGEPAAIVRIWMIGKKVIKGPDGETIDEDDSFLKCTIALGPDEAACTDHDRGIRMIDLRDPSSCDQILAWMVLIGIAPRGSKWRDPA